MQILLGRALAPTLHDYFYSRVANDDRVQFLDGSLDNFVSGEAFAEILSNGVDFSGEPITIVQSLGSIDDQVIDGEIVKGSTANDLAMQLLLAVRTLKKNNAGPIWVQIPSMGYDRQDREFEGRSVSTGIEDFAIMLKEAGAVGVSTMEIHSAAALKFLEDSFGRGNVFNLDPTEIFARDIQGRIDVGNAVTGGPDEGANIRRDTLAEALGTDKFTITKKHKSVNETVVTGFEGDVKGKATITVDDMVDTGGTIEKSQIRLAEQGASSRHIYSARPLLSDNALKRLFTAKTGGGAYAVTDMTFLDTVNIGAKLSQLRAEYGDAAVAERVRVLKSGAAFYDHMANEILTHQSMEAHK